MAETGWILDEDAALAEVSHGEHVAPVADVRHRNSEQSSELEDLAGGVLFEPGTDHFLGERAVLAPPAHRVEPIVADEVGTADHVGEEHRVGPGDEPV